MEAYYTCSYIAALHSGQGFWLDKYTQYTYWTKNPDFAHCVMLRPVLPPPHLDINILSRVHQLINSCDIWCVLTSAQCRLTQCAPLHCIVYCICIFVAALSGVSDTFLSTVNRILYTVVTFPFPIWQFQPFSSISCHFLSNFLILSDWNKRLCQLL